MAEAGLVLAVAVALAAGLAAFYSTVYLLANYLQFQPDQPMRKCRRRARTTSAGPQHPSRRTAGFATRADADTNNLATAAMTVEPAGSGAWAKAGPMLKLQAIDALLVGTFAIVAAIGVATHCLLINDGAVFLLAGWLGDGQDLFFAQSSARAVSVLASFGPAWLARWAFGLSSGAYLWLAHVLYFVVPLVLWWHG